MLRRVTSFQRTRLATAVAMTTVGQVRFISGYTLFLKENAKTEEISALAKNKGFGAVARLMSQRYKALSPSDLEALKKRADEIPSAPRKSKMVKKVKKNRPKRAPTAYNTFVKENIGNAELAGLTHKEKFVKVAAMWKKQKPQ